MVGNVFSQNFSFSSCALGPWIVILIFSSFEHNYLRTHSYSTYVHSVHSALRVLFLCSRVQKAAMEYWIFSTLLFYTNFYTVNSYSKCISKWSIEESVKHLNKSTSALEFFLFGTFIIRCSDAQLSSSMKDRLNRIQRQQGGQFTTFKDSGGILFESTAWYSGFGKTH